MARNQTQKGKQMKWAIAGRSKDRLEKVLSALPGTQRLSPKNPPFSARSSGKIAHMTTIRRSEECCNSHRGCGGRKEPGRYGSAHKLLS
jgi:hypothetical protein